MKFIFPVLLIVTVAMFSNCTKSRASIVQINCDGLLTDTPDTGDSGRIYIPNAITPNDDGLNELLTPVTKNIDSSKFTIYDENNMVVFTTNLLGNGWIAPQSLLPIVRYYYKIKAVTNNNKKIGVCGDAYAITCYTINPPRSIYYFADMLTLNCFTGSIIENLTTSPERKLTF